MTKFTNEEKLKAVLDYLNGRESYRDIGKRIGISHKGIEKWVNLYKVHGYEGLISKYTSYPAQFKMDVINYINVNRTSLLETASLFGIPTPSTILQWKRILEEQGPDALKTKRGRPQMTKHQPEKQPKIDSQEELLSKIKYLEMENAYLKKLNALVQEERKLKNGKKLK